MAPNQPRSSSSTFFSGGAAAAAAAAAGSSRVRVPNVTKPSPSPTIGHLSEMARSTLPPPRRGATEGGFRSSLSRSLCIISKAQVLDNRTSFTTPPTCDWTHPLLHSIFHSFYHYYPQPYPTLIRSQLESSTLTPTPTPRTPHPTRWNQAQATQIQTTHPH